MANDKNQTELNSLNLFGDLAPGDPSITKSDNLMLFPILADIADYLGTEEQAGGMEGFALIVAAYFFAQAKRDAFSKEYLLVTENGIFYDTDSYSWPSEEPNKSKLKYDPIRQSLGSVRCIDTHKAMPDHLDDGKEKVELSFNRNTFVYNEGTGQASGLAYLAEINPWHTVPVFNPQSASPAIAQIGETSEVMLWDDFSLIGDPEKAHPSSPFCKNFQGIGLKRIGISDPIFFSQFNLQEARKIEHIYIFQSNYSGNNGASYGYGTSVNSSTLTSNFMYQAALLNLLFTIDQKREGFNLLGVPGYESALEAYGSQVTDIYEGAGAALPDVGIYGSDTLSFDSGYDDLAGRNGSEVVDVSFFEELSEQGTVESADDVLQVYALGVMPKIVNHVCENIMFEDGDPMKGFKFFSDHSFSCKKAQDATYEYLLPYHPLGNMGASQPTARIQPVYNYLSYKYESALSSYGNILSEKALPNIYLFDKCKSISSDSSDQDGESTGTANGILVPCHEKYNFEKFGSKILDCGKIGKIEDLNNSPDTKAMSNIIVKALQSSFGQPETAMPKSLQDSVLEQLKDYPMFVDIQFTGDESDVDVDNRNVWGTPENYVEGYKIAGDEIMKTFHSSGMVHEFIKSLIYNQFSGQNSTNPPATDAEKFAKFSSINIAQPVSDPGLVRVVSTDLPNNDTITGDDKIYNNKIYWEQENKTIYDFDEWLKVMLSEYDYYYAQNGTPGTAENFIYKINDIKKSSIDLTEPDIGKTTSLYTPFHMNSWLGWQLVAFYPKYIDFRNGFARTYKQCVSKVLNKQGDLTYLNSVQGTLFYRIAKFAAEEDGGELIQNIFIPATNVPDSKISPPGSSEYRYIDTQVKYGKRYRYKISAYKIVVGTKYRYDLAPYNSNLVSEESSGGGDSLNGTIDDLADKLGFNVDSLGEVSFYKKTGMSALAKPIHTPVYRTPLFIGPGAPDGEDVPATGFVDGGTLTFFSVISQPSVKIIEVPYFQDMQTVILDRPPLPPITNMYPLVGRKNDILISFENQIGQTEEVPVPIFDEDEIYFQAERIQQRRSLIKLSNHAEPQLYFPTLQFKSDGFPYAYEVFRLDGIAPTSYQDFSNAKYGKVLLKDATSFVDNINTNIDYYYTFRTMDVHGNISNPTPIYKLRMVEDSGAVYPLINIVSFDEGKNYKDSREFNRYLQIDLADIHKYLNQVESNLTNETAINPNTQPYLGIAPDGNPWNNQYEFTPANAKRYKFRIKSKKSGRIIDLNVGFFVRHKFPDEEVNPCGDNTAPMAPGNTKQDDVVSAHTDNADSTANQGDGSATLGNLAVRTGDYFD